MTWAVLIAVGWWFLAILIPGLPTPIHAAKSLFSLVKSVGDDIYEATNREGLEEAAKRVREAAEEVDQHSDAEATEDKLHHERRKKLPAIPIHEDSSLRETMKEISKTPIVRGRVINILLIGIDSRLGVRDSRADAIHLITVNPDSAIVEILSIPRDTYVDLGYPDTTSFNVIANARAGGYEGFMRRVSELAHRGPIKYYAEVGFSQAMGVLEILGYKDPVNTLKFLRTRKTLPGGDVQRSYNQGNFLRQNLIDKFGLLTGVTGELILTAGLHFVKTNLTKDFCKGMIYSLEQKNFPDHRRDAVRLRMLPMYKIRLKEMVADSLTIANTLERNRRIVGEEEMRVIDVANHLRKMNRLALADSTRPDRVISRLRRLSEQHAWLQVRNMEDRAGIRDTLLMALERAYRRKGNVAEAESIVNLRRSEDLLFQGLQKPESP